MLTPAGALVRVRSQFTHTLWSGYIVQLSYTSFSFQSELSGPVVQHMHRFEPLHEYAIETENAENIWVWFVAGKRFILTWLRGFHACFLYTKKNVLRGQTPLPRNEWEKPKKPISDTLQRWREFASCSRLWFDWVEKLAEKTTLSASISIESNLKFTTTKFAEFLNWVSRKFSLKCYS